MDLDITTSPGVKSSSLNSASEAVNPPKAHSDEPANSIDAEAPTVDAPHAQAEGCEASAGAVAEPEGCDTGAEASIGSEDRDASPEAVAEVGESELDSPTEDREDVFAGVPAPLKLALEGRGFDSLTAVQQAVLGAEAGGRDLQISSQTGSGKTVGLGLVLAPRLESVHTGSGPEALIIVPTRELANQVSEELSWLFAGLPGVRVASVTGGTPVFRDRQMLRRGPRVLVGTPGRLLDHVKSRALDLSGVQELVLDEADQMLDMGFREELEGILDTTPEERRTHLVSATFPNAIRDLAARYQREPMTIEGTRLGDANQDIEHEGHLLSGNDRYGALVNRLLQADGEKTLVFVERRAEAVELAEMLEEDGFAALPLSGELAQSQRERTLGAFRSGRATVLVATDVAARGLDVPDVAMVIHTSPPIDAQVYTHRSGRTGRAGKSGRSVLFAPANRKRRIARLLSDAGVKLRWVPVPTAAEVREQLDAAARAELQKELDAALENGPPEAQLAHALELLDKHEAAPLVATLLARLQPSHRAEPRDVETAQEDRGTLRPQRGRRDRPGGGAPSGGRNDYRSEDRRGGHRDGGQRDGGRQRGVRFFVNWGMNQGASPGRLLAAVCRRGDVSGSDIGSIAIHPNASTFDVNPAVAERFERLAGRRDERDPYTRIRRDRGPEGPRRPRD